MEFSYRISEEQFQRIWRLERTVGSRASIRRMLLFWVLILVCLVLLWVIVERGAPAPPADFHPPLLPVQSAAGWAAILPLIGVAAAWIALFRLAPREHRSAYLKDPVMQGEFTVNINPQSISMRNSAGVNSQWNWNLYDHWRESRELILLVPRSGTNLPISLAHLPDFQRAELRSTIAQKLPRK